MISLVYCGLSNPVRMKTAVLTISSHFTPVVK
jgi:hypothetical protein